METMQIVGAIAVITGALIFQLAPKALVKPPPFHPEPAWPVSHHLKPAAAANFDAFQFPFTQPPPYGRGRYTKVLGNPIYNHKATVVSTAMHLLITL